MMSIRAVCAALATIAFLQNCRIWCFAGDQVLVCGSEDCRKLAKTYKQNMNMNVNPCHNFYQFACGGWAKHHPMSEGELYYSVTNLLSRDAYFNLMRALESHTETNSTKIKQARALYGSCFNIKSAKRYNSTAMVSKLKTVTEWPDAMNTMDVSEPWEYDHNFIRMSGESALFGYEIILNEEKQMEFTIEIRPLISPYGMIKRLSKWENKEDELAHYKSFLTKLIKSVSVNNALSDTELDNSLNEVINFREKLRHISNKTSKYEKHVATIEEMQQWYDKSNKRKENAKIKWVQELRPTFRLLHGPFGVNITKESRVKVNENFTIALGNLLVKTENRVIVNHIHLYYLERHMILTEELRADLNKSITGESRNTGLIREIEDPWILCFTKENMKDTLKKIYVDSYFPPESRQYVTAMLHESKNVLRDQIKSATWLSDPAKAQALEKVDRLQAAIGYLDPGNSKINLANLDPLDVGAYYMPFLNGITITAAYMQLPVYSREVPFAINFGSTGSVLGHELYHAFDSNGIQYDADGNRRNLWPHPFQSQHAQHLRCFKNLYKFYATQELKSLKKRTTRSNTVMETADEDLSDVMGLKAAYKAYRNVLARQNGVCATLPGLERFDCDKLFFLAFATGHCAVANDQGAEYILLENEHSMPATRVNGAVGNMWAFSNAFKCNKKDPMNFPQRCDFWKP